MAKLAGCEVVGVVGTTAKVAAAKTLGVDHVIDKSTENLWRRAEQLAPDGYDVILDANGVSTLGASYEHLRRAGKLVVYGFHSMMPKSGGRPNWPKLALDASLKPLNDRLLALGYALARVWFALLILPSGYEKVFENGAARIAAGNVLKTGFYPPMFWAWVVALLEFVGMILLALGLGTRLVAFMMAIELGVIVLTIQAPNGWFWTSRGTEFALILFLVCIAFVIGGGGRYSLDRRLGREF